MTLDNLKAAEQENPYHEWSRWT